MILAALFLREPVTKKSAGHFLRAIGALLLILGNGDTARAGTAT